MTNTTTQQTITLVWAYPVPEVRWAVNKETGKHVPHTPAEFKELNEKGFAIRTVK